MGRDQWRIQGGAREAQERAQEIRESGIQVSLTKGPESSALNPERRIPWIH